MARYSGRMVSLLALPRRGVRKQLYPNDASDFGGKQAPAPQLLAAANVILGARVKATGVPGDNNITR